MATTRLSRRGRDLRWLTRHRGCTEQPPGSNTDNRHDGIRAAQLRLAPWLIGQPWCGVWAANGLLAAGVHGVTARLASVSLIEEDAKAHRRPFRGWTTDSREVIRGDLAVLFGPGVHVETVRRIFRPLGLVRTDGGNTTSGAAGDQANGGGSYPRWRRLSDVYGFALVDFPNR